MRQHRLAGGPAALALIAARPDIFARQGYVAAGYRRRGGKTFGPYYSLRYRENGQQRSIYLGRQRERVEQVRRALAVVQRPWIQRRTPNRLTRSIRASLRVHKQRLDALLRPLGLHLKVFEVRGWRGSPIRGLLAARHQLTAGVLPRRLLPACPTLPGSPLQYKGRIPWPRCTPMRQ